MKSAKVRALPLLALLLPLDILAAGAILITDILTSPIRLFRRPSPRFSPPDPQVVTIQILNWDGKHLLNECLPSVIEAAGSHRILVVDNGSTDGSVEYLKERFPSVRILALDRNYGFAAGNNRGFELVDTDIVVLLNNDMFVGRAFLQPLIDALKDPAVFAATSQITFADPARRREETGKTRAAFKGGFFHLWHAEIKPVDEAAGAIPVFWAGGGSCAIDRRKLALVGGFDDLYHPFYVEDVDLSYQAWKRGWKSVLAARSRVVHKHRGTSGPRFGDAFVDRVTRRNQFLLFWKNVTDPSMVLAHVLNLPRIHGSAILERGGRFELHAYTRALLRLPAVLWRRVANLRTSVVRDRDVIR